MAFYSGAGQEVRARYHREVVCVLRSCFGWPCIAQQQMAQRVLTQFEEHPDAWTRVPEILERSSFPQSKVSATMTAATRR